MAGAIVEAAAAAASSSSSAPALFEQMVAKVKDSDEGGPSKRRRLQRRNTEQQIQRAISDHFGSVTDMQLHHTLFEGKTLHQTIYEHKKQAKAKQRNCGPRWWAQLKANYGIGSVIAELKVENPKSTIAPELLKALYSATDKNPAKRTLQPLIQTVQIMKDFNQKERVGLVRFFLEKMCASNKKTRDLLVAFAEAMTRCKHHTCVEVGFVKAPLCIVP